MQLDKLRIELRPRPHAQGLDLGFALLRAHAGDAYRAWLAVWLPACALAGLLSWQFPSSSVLWIGLAWWLRPLFERAPLYVLSRQVFGQDVGWADALRAWPRQLPGGALRMLFFWRPFMAGRGLHQPVWQLEHARGAAATGRRAAIARNGTGAAAWWFGLACLSFELILTLGLVSFLSLFQLDDGGADFSPLALARQPGILLASYALAAGIVAPAYVACCFTLYLNRRATLEAWDIELMLRQIRPPARTPARQAARHVASLFAASVLAAAYCCQPAEATAAALDAAMAAAPSAAQCPRPGFKGRAEPVPARGPDQDAEQARLRADLDRIYAHDDFHDYVCEEVWRSSDAPEEEKHEDKLRDRKPNEFALLSELLEMLLIAGAVGAALWLLYRYRGSFPSFARTVPAEAATEIGGLDIRADSLPDDVTASVRALWASGERRAALALLYRATLSHLVSQDDLHLYTGATEGDCLALARRAHAAERLGSARLHIATDVTTLWLSAAYGNRWPDTAALERHCEAWQAQFGQVVKAAA